MPLPSQPELILWIALRQVQGLARRLLEPHVVHMGPLLEPAKVPLGGISPLKPTNSTTQLGAISKPAAMLYVSNEPMK